MRKLTELYPGVYGQLAHEALISLVVTYGGVVLPSRLNARSIISFKKLVRVGFAVEIDDTITITEAGRKYFARYVR
jgi:hypothetical protein